MRAVFDDNLVTGNEMIDGQHKELIDRVNKLLESCYMGTEKRTAIQTLNFLLDYTEFHFQAEEKLQEAIDSVEEYGGGKINFIVCSRGVRRKLISALSAYRKTDSIDLEGGYRALSFNGIPVVADRFCPKGTMYLLNTDDFGLHQLCDWQWLEGEDGKILKQIPGKPVYTATLVKYAELMCYRPVGQGMLANITE